MTLQVNATSDVGTVSYQWFKDGTALSGATASSYSIPSLSSGDAGYYSVTVSDGVTSLTSRIARIQAAIPAEGHLTNMSVRSVAGLGGNALTVGFNVANGSKDVVIRAIGPTLAAFSVQGTLGDPTMTVFDASSVEVASNNDWGDAGLASTLSSAFSHVGAFALVDGSKDAALITTASGNRTVQVKSNVTGESGVVLVEAYDNGTGIAQRLNNVSALNFAGSGDQTLIVGFVIDGNVPKQVLIRAVGPRLADFGVSGFLVDPQLELHSYFKDSADNEVDAVYGTNDNWESEPGATNTAFSSFGAFTLLPGSKDAAMLVTLPPGRYTAHATGANNTTGMAIIEVYEHL